MRSASISFGSATMLGAAVAACGGTDVTTYVQPPPVEAAEHASWPTSEDASWVFDEDAIRSYELELSGADWAHLREHALDEEYRPALLRVDGMRVGEVGLRFKGSGTLRRCTRNGRLICRKHSMKVRFDEYEPSRRFFGLKRLNFHSKVHLHERLAYRLFREMGVVAPRSVHGTLTINGENFGVFDVVENIDGRFTDDRFEDGDGNLYKERWPNSADERYLGSGLETNEETGNHDAMLAFQAALAAARPAELPAVVEHFMNVEELYAYLAVDRAIANYDGVTAFYCRSRSCNNHNYYLYQREAEARFTLIPWDLDNTFFISNSFDYVPRPFVTPADCSQRFPVFAGLSVLAPGCDPLLRGLVSSDPARYHEMQARLLEGPFELGALEQWIDERVARLSPAVINDAEGPGLTAFLLTVQELRRSLSLLAERLRVERDGGEVVRSRLAVGATNDFESATSTGVRFGFSGRTTLGTDFAIRIATTDALAGARDVALEYELRDGPEPPWVRFALPFDDPDPFDLNQVSRLRLMLQTDAPRMLRIGFGSEGYSQYLPRAVVGWDVQADGTRQQIDLALSDATFPLGADPVPESPSDVLQRAVELLIDPVATRTQRDGFLGVGVAERGWIRIDQIEFVPSSTAPQPH